MTEKKILLSVDNVAIEYRRRQGWFKYFRHTAIDGISFDVFCGETLGILGRNGCGKSSLLRVLAGIVNPTRGTVICTGNIKRALLTLGVGFRPDLSGRDNAVLSAMLQGMSRKQACASVQGIKEFSELDKFFDRPVNTYSAGMRARLGFSTAIVTEVDLLLIDEILSVGDMHFRRKAEQVMREKINSDQTVVFVSHSEAQIDRVCGRALWLERGVIKCQGDTAIVSNKYKSFMESLDVK